MSIERLTASLAERYTIERELGAGGMATVYLARDLRHDRDVAIKVLHPDLGAALGGERFLAEVKITAGLAHPHILTLIDSGEAGGTLFYVMPFVRGESLRAKLDRERQLSIDEALGIARQIASALEYAHHEGVIHRDIKPENILLHEGEAFLTDFGIALAVREAGGERLTGTGLSLGTPSYMSPEQAAGDRHVDARSDIYALGAVTYEMLAGEPPFSGASVQAMIAKLMTERPTALRVLRDSVPPAMEAAIMRALAKAPVDRFATARQFSEALVGGPPMAPLAGAVAPAGPTSRKWAGVAAGVLLIGAAAIYLLGHRGTASGGAQVATIRSIAVLPLDNYSADSTQDYFAEGMTDELTTDLSTISALRVTSRGSAMQFGGKKRPSTPEIAKALDVDAIVEGSVTRSGDKVRISAQLIDARADKHLWARTFERQSSDVLALQAELASAIAEAINAQLTPGEKARLAAAPSVAPAVYEAYLKGRYFFNRPSDTNLEKAIAQFDEAVRLNPDFAPAWSGLSDAYVWAAYSEGFISAKGAGPKARAAAARAIELDSNAAEGHASLGTYLAWFAHDWAGGERELRRAIALNSSYAYAHDQLGLMLGILGRFDEAIAEGKKALVLDPLSPSILVDVATPLTYRHDTAAVAALVQRAVDLDPTLFFPATQMGWLNLQMGNYPAAVVWLEKARGMGAPSFVLGWLGYTYSKAGELTKAKGVLTDLKRASLSGDGAPFDLAIYFLGQGNTARALDYLEQAFSADAQSLVMLKIDPIYDPLRKEPRFIALMQQMHFAT